MKFAILDCISFIRHFFYLFHRLRSNFLETYQELILAELENSIGQPVKEAFLAMCHFSYQLSVSLLSEELR
ncbi:hypothetical protein ACP6PL_17440 [Dapis sp. BLCC M126]|uniref:hypothetical protein n=1 Tax=Dapis sp. BLCC M126 TaxID=3400189 RepID=UPI003CF17956